MKKVRKVLNRKERTNYVEKPELDEYSEVSEFLPIDIIDRENYIEKRPEDVYTNIAQKFPEYSKEDVAKIGGVESQHGKFDKNLAGSSSKGLFQFMPKTAEAIKPGSRSSLSDMNTQEELMINYLDRNTDRIKKIKENPTIEDAYLYHNLGPGAGRKFLNAKDNHPISSILSEEIIKKNPKLYNYKTVGEAKLAIKKMMQERGNEFEFQPVIQDIFKEK